MDVADLVYSIVKGVISGYVLIRFGIMVKKYGGFWNAVHKLRGIIFDGEAENAEVESDTNNNLVLARGKVVGIGHDRHGNRRFTMHVRGTKDKNEAYISFAFGYGLKDAFDLYDTIDVEGHYVSYVPEGDSGRPVQYFVADKITKSVTELKKIFGVDGFAYDNTFCKAYFKGKVTELNLSAGGLWMNARVKIAGKPENHFAVVQYTKNMRVNDLNVGVGDNVCMACNVTSKKKMRGEKELHFEDIILDDWAVMEKAS